MTGFPQLIIDIKEEATDMKNSNRKRTGGKTRSIIALSVVRVLTVVLFVVGVTGMPLDARGLY